MKQRPWVCYFVGICMLIYLLLAGVTIVAIHTNCFPSLEQFQLLRAHFMCAGFGMLGAALAATRKYYRALITETTESGTSLSWDFGWVFYYVTRPILGSILGALSYMLSYIGFSVLAGPTAQQISTEGRFALYSLALISGFSVSQVLDRLKLTAKQFFKPRPGSEGA